MSLQPLQTRPWGHKVTLHIYMAGVPEAAQGMASHLAEKIPKLTPGVDFIGVSVDVVQDEPKDQGGA